MGSRPVKEMGPHANKRLIDRSIRLERPTEARMKLMDAPNAVLERPTRTRVGQSSRGVAGLGEADKGQIYRLWLQGVAPEVLADRFGISRAGVGRIVNETRARRLLEQ